MGSDHLLETYGVVQKIGGNFVHDARECCLFTTHDDGHDLRQFPKSTIVCPFAAEDHVYFRRNGRIAI